MPLSRDEVVRAYKVVLGREPESDFAIDHMRGRALDVYDAVAGLLNSPEYKSKIDYYPSYSSSDLAILARYAIQSEPSDGFITDFLGNKTDISFIKNISHLSGTVEGLPVPSNFHAEAIEWIGTLKAVDGAGQQFAVAEIGAGWGPWLVAAGSAARKLGKTVFMAGVEADPGHFESLRRHLGNNGFDPADHRLLLAAIGLADGWAFFPRIDSALDWGAAAVFQTSDTPPTHDYRSHAMSYDRVRAVSLESALGDRQVFDLLHIDIQGSERELIPAALDTLNRKVRWIVLGTHSRAIEGEMIETLGTDWTLEHEKPCRFRPDGERIGPRQTVLDGAQVWRNRKF